MSFISTSPLEYGTVSADRKRHEPNLSPSDFWAQVGTIGGGAAAGIIVGDLLPYSSYGPSFAIIFVGSGLVIYNVVRKSKMR